MLTQLSPTSSTVGEALTNAGALIGLLTDMFNMQLEHGSLQTRTLQRKLKEEGVSFLQIVDEVRPKLAIHYLTSGNYPIKDVAYILGYNEPSAFIRAFKRWTGKTPMEYTGQFEWKVV